MADTNLPTILVDRSKIANTLRLNINMQLRIDGFSHAEIERALVTYREAGLARIDDIVTGLVKRRSIMVEYGKALVEPTIGDLVGFKGATHYGVEICGDLPKEVRDVLHAYLAAN